jgi:hypothetical protein
MPAVRKAARFFSGVAVSSHGGVDEQHISWKPVDSAAKTPMSHSIVSARSARLPFACGNPAVGAVRERDRAGAFARLPRSGDRRGCS